MKNKETTTDRLIQSFVYSFEEYIWITRLDKRVINHSILDPIVNIPRS